MARRNLLHPETDRGPWLDPSRGPGERADGNGANEIYPGCNYSDQERRFGAAMDRYKRKNHRPFPSWREVLRVLIALGYRLVEKPQPPRSA